MNGFMKMNRNAGIEASQRRSSVKTTKELIEKRKTVSRNVWLALMVCLLGLFGLTAGAEQKIVPPDGSANNKFGYSVDVDGDWMVVGAPADENSGRKSGSAYLYKWVGGVWTNTQRVSVSDEWAFDEFGTAVAIDGDYLIVGAPMDNVVGPCEDAGSAYIYKRNGDTWVQQIKLFASDPAQNDQFGWAVDISGDQVICGAKGKSAAYVFRGTNTVWSQTGKLTGSPYPEFGYSVAIKGTNVLVGQPGAYYITESYHYSRIGGQVHLFNRQTNGVWSLSGAWAGGDDRGNLRFGTCVDLCGQYLVSSAPNGQFIRFYAFTNNQWVAKNEKGALPSTALAAKAGYVVVGNANDNGGKGSMSVYNLDTLDPIRTLVASDAVAGDNYGLSVGISSNHLVVGSPYDDDKGDSSGAVYSYEDYTLAHLIITSNGGTVTGTGEGPGFPVFIASKEVELTATPDSFHKFSYWLIKGTANSNNPVRFLAEDDLNITAVFSQFSVSNNQVRFDFNDQAWDTAANAASTFTNSGTVGGTYHLMGGPAGVYSGVTFGYNDGGGTALCFSNGANSSIYLEGPTVQWGQKFTMETRLKWGGSITGALDLVTDMDSVTGISPVRWRIETNGVMALILNDGQLMAKTVSPVLQKDAWMAYQVVVDLTQTSMVDSVKMYTNGAPLELAPAGNGSVYGGQLASGTATVTSSTFPLVLLKRSATFPLEVDFIRVNAYQPVAGNVSDFYGGEVYSEIASNASISIMIRPPDVLKRVCNPITDFNSAHTAPNSGKTVVYDTHPNPPSVFHGVFEIKCALESQAFDAGAIYVDIFLKKPEDGVFKKIGTVAAPTKPTNSTWWVKYYWDSRTAAYDWTSSDAMPYRTTGDVQLKFEVR